jgi:pyruvate dehydrogenase E2 component (dihydrolipoamide acetyltransferase)
MPAEIIVPPLSQTSDSLVLQGWLKKPGDKVSKGEALFTVETDKASLEVESPESGTLFEVYAQSNSEITVRTVIGLILRDGEQPPQSPAPNEAKQVPTPKSAPEPAPVVQKEAARTAKPGKGIFSSPRARRLADEKGLDIRKATPTGPRGMVVERDVMALLSTQAPAATQTPATRGSAEALPQSIIRKVIAKRMMESHLGTAPVSYMAEVDATNLVVLRSRILEQLPEGAVRPTYTDLFIRTVCLAVKQHPQFNATVKDDQLEVHPHVRMALAVDTDRGLIVPVMPNVDEMTLTQVAAKRQVLAARAIAGELQPDELSGGTFTITNLGTMGIDTFTPIINPPQVAILGIGRIREIPAVKDGGIYIRSVVNLSLTCDHRYIDGGPAARFMSTLAQLIEDASIIA